MKFYEVSETIVAPPQSVWEVLSDGPGYMNWESGIIKFEGTIARGRKIKLFPEVSPGRAFPLKVVELVPGERMVWRGGMPLGLFTGERTYTLTPENGSTVFHMREEFTGPLVGLMWKSMPDLGPSFTKFATGLKARVETANG